ncbi:hypothetical protein D3C87_2073450 [compost metagenome]
MAHPAIVMPDDEYLVRTQFVNSYDDASHNAPERCRYDAARSFNNFDVTVLDVHAGRQQLDQPGIHTG